MTEEIITTANTLPLIGDKAPSFKGKTTDGPISFPEDYKGKWVVFFSHPGDFTPVCTTEFMAFASRHSEFRALNCELLGLSVGSVASHIGWMEEIRKKVEWNGLKNVEITFPITEDDAAEIAKKYGMLQPNASSTKTVRAVFIIDPEGTIRTILYYPLTTGRYISEIVRIVKALQKADADGVSTPADWQPGDDVIIPIPGSYKEVRERVENPKSGTYCTDWFLCFKKEK